MNRSKSNQEMYEKQLQDKQAELAKINGDLHA